MRRPTKNMLFVLMTQWPPATRLGHVVCRVLARLLLNLDTSWAGVRALSTVQVIAPVHADELVRRMQTQPHVAQNSCWSRDDTCNWRVTGWCRTSSLRIRRLQT